VDRFVHRFDRIDDVVAMWDVGCARDAAWTNFRRRGMAPGRYFKEWMSEQLAARA